MELEQTPSLPESTNVSSKLNELIFAVTLSIDKYEITKAARQIENFAVNELSLWYIRRSRERFQKPKTKQELTEASQVLSFTLLTLSKLTAPFIPFLSEEIYQRLKNTDYATQNSIHLEGWPKGNKKLIDKRLHKKMEKTRAIVSQALAQRAAASIKVRQPLNELTIPKGILAAWNRC